MEKENLNEFLYNYLRLCDAFKNSNTFWKKDPNDPRNLLDQQYKESESLLLLYKPLELATTLLKSITNGDKIDNHYNDIHYIADKVWYVLDNKSDVRGLISKNPIEINESIVNVLLKYCDSPTCRANHILLKDVSGKVWELLGGDK